MRTHQDIDTRSLAMHRLIADKIRRDPRQLEKVRHTLAHWRKTVCASSQPYLESWERLMSQGVETCLAAAVEDSEHAAALRQCSPFCGVLSNQERFAFLKAWKHVHEAQGA